MKAKQRCWVSKVNKYTWNNKSMKQPQRQIHFSFWKLSERISVSLNLWQVCFSWFSEIKGAGDALNRSTSEHAVQWDWTGNDQCDSLCSCSGLKRTAVQLDVFATNKHGCVLPSWLCQRGCCNFIADASSYEYSKLLLNKSAQFGAEKKSPILMQIVEERVPFAVGANLKRHITGNVWLVLGNIWK